MSLRVSFHVLCDLCRVSQPFARNRRCCQDCTTVHEAAHMKSRASYYYRRGWLTRLSGLKRRGSQDDLVAWGPSISTGFERARGENDPANVVRRDGEE